MHFSSFRSFFSFLLLIMPGAAFGVTPGSTGQVLNIISMLIVVLTVIAVLALLAKRMLPGVKGSGRHIKVLEVMPLGKSERLCLVQVGEQTLLLGVSQSGIRRLESWDDLPEVSSKDEAPLSPEFSTVLARLMKSR